MSRELVVVGLVLIATLAAPLEGADCPITTPLQAPSDPDNICMEVNLCAGQKITFLGNRCVNADRITIWFYVNKGPYANPQFDARFGYGGRYLYQANNRGVNGWGPELIFNKKMELGPDASFAMEFLVQSDNTIEWKIDGSSIGTYTLRENGQVGDIKMVCLDRCATISSMMLTPI